MAPLFPGIVEFGERFGVTIVTAYSMTELPMVFCSNTFYDVTNDNYRLCGHPDPSVDVRLADDHGNDVGDGEPGELLARAAEGVITPGYLNNPEATATAWRGGWFHTGDVFTRDGDGRYAFVDRKKDAIRRRGENISSMEVEVAINTFPAVLECAVYAVPSDLAEDDVKVAIVVAPGHEFAPAELSIFFTLGCRASRSRVTSRCWRSCRRRRRNAFVRPNCAPPELPRRRGTAALVEIVVERVMEVS